MTHHPVRIAAGVAAIMIAGGLAGTAQAQSAAPAAGSNDAIPEKQAPGAAAPNSDVSNKGGSLSDKLNSTSGVIHPQGNVDPAMGKPAPSTGTMPVIPAPGSPGGRSDIQPK